MDDIFVYEVRLPDGVDEMVMPCLGGYTIYLDNRLSDEGKRKAYGHALYHIKNKDFEKVDVQEIEANAHMKGE